MHFNIPNDCRVRVSFIEWKFINIVFLLNVKQGSISSHLDRSELVVVPVLIEDILDVYIRLSTIWQFHMLYCALFTHKRPQPQKGMSCLLLFAIKAILIEFVLKLFFQEFFQLWLLWLSWGLEKLDVATRCWLFNRYFWIGNCILFGLLFIWRLIFDVQLR